MPNPSKLQSVKGTTSSPSRLKTRSYISETRWEVIGVLFVIIYTLFTPLNSFYSQNIRNEVGPNCVDIGQVAYVALKFRAPQQPDAGFVFRELLKNVCVLYDGIGMASGF